MIEYQINFLGDKFVKNETKHKLMREHHIENEFVELWLENGIIYEVFKPKISIIDINSAKEIVAARLKISNGIVRPIFIDMTDVTRIEKETRVYFATSESTQLLSAGALLVKNPIIRSIVNFSFIFEHPRFTVKAFTNKEKALKWLELFKQSSNLN